MRIKKILSIFLATAMALTSVAGTITTAAADSQPSAETTQEVTADPVGDDSGTVTYAADPEAAVNADSGSTITSDDAVTTDDVASSIVMDDGSELTSLMAAPMMLGASAGQTVQLDYTHIISYTNDAGEGNGAHVFRFTTDGVNYYYAYCTRPDMQGPDPGTYPTVALTDPLRLKILYYGFGGPGDITGYLGSQDETVYRHAFRDDVCKVQELRPCGLVGEERGGPRPGRENPGTAGCEVRRRRRP
jgi:hypothetical protein